MCPRLPGCDAPAKTVSRASTAPPNRIAANPIGARTCGGALLLVACVAAGALLGLTATAGAAAARPSRAHRAG